jgi:Holliday junction resolvase
LLSDQGFDGTELDSLINHFVLPARADWAEVSPPFRGKDWWPWRYRRHLSMMARPLIAINETEIAYAPAFCEDAFRHVIMGSHTGAFETEYFTSRSMKEYIGAENARRGLAFNKSVANAFENLGWNVIVELQMTRLEAPHTEASGDIDVVAMKDGIVYICECKELLFARTITEVVEQLGRFRANRGDALWKHMRRVSWVRTHPRRLNEIVGRELTDIRSLLVTSKLVPMQFAKDFPVQTIAIDSLESIFE